MSRWVVRLGPNDGGWAFSSREAAEKWCEQFGNRFIIEEVES